MFKRTERKFGHHHRKSEPIERPSFGIRVQIATRLTRIDRKESATITRITFDWISNVVPAKIAGLSAKGE